MEKFKYLVLNHSRKKYLYSNSDYCYREVRGGKEVTTPSEFFTVLSGLNAVKSNIPVGYTKFSDK